MSIAHNPRIVALIPARSGSKRVPGKNVRRLASHPLIAYTIAAARESGVFSAVIVSTDSPGYAEIARHYGADVPFLRPAEISGDLSPDIEWVEFTMRQLGGEASYDCFSILRPTNPFRVAGTIRRAWTEFKADPSADSLRAVEPCRQHPGKMWVLRGRRLLPLLPMCTEGQPWHSSQYQALPQVFVQNASLEIARTHVVSGGRTIAGEAVLPFFTRDYEGFDVNSPIDWQVAEGLVQSGTAGLPSVPQSPFEGSEVPA